MRAAFRRAMREAGPYAFVAPAAFVMGLVLVYPLYFGIYISLHSWQLGSPWQTRVFVGFSNFETIFNSSVFWTVIRVTLVFTSVATLSALAIGFGLALLLEGKIRGIELLRSLFMLPFMIAPVVVALIWAFLYNPMFGLINYGAGLLGLRPQAWLASPSLALPALILADVWQWTPFMLILLLAGLQSLPQDTLDAAQVDGCSYMQTLFHVKLPLLKPVLAIAFIFGWIEAFKVVDLVYNLTFGGPGKATTVLSMQIYQMAFGYQRLGQASSYSVVLLLIQLLLSIVFLLVFKPMRVGWENGASK